MYIVSTTGNGIVNYLRGTIGVRLGNHAWESRLSAFRCFRYSIIGCPGDISEHYVLISFMMAGETVIMIRGHTMAREIAIYGKGGIGKSTIAANLSAVLAERGLHVLQIGCDPKHDSTRLLLDGARVTTVLDYIRVTNPMDYHLEDVLSTGYGDVGCIEAGGPEPGVGCAGRGIITAFKLLDQFHVKDDYDLVIYDVLGDVVCGGFAVPVRREYADTIFLVTSGEFMAIYAANNILRGIANYDEGDRCRVAGIIHNARGLRDEDKRVAAFADAVGLPVIAKIPRDDEFERAEKSKCTLIQLEPAADPEVLRRFVDIADLIVSGIELHPARPLSDELLEEVVIGSSASTAQQADVPVTGDAEEPYTHGFDDGAAHHETTGGVDTGYLSKNVVRDEPLHGCAFNGAVSMSVHITDAMVLSHGPRSCTYISYQCISSPGRRRLFERGTLMPTAIAPNLVSTDMDEADMVFGGTDRLLEVLRGIVGREGADRPRAVIVISACTAGIIGDDIDVVKTLSTPEVPVITVKADGNLSGDFMQGMLDTYTQLARQIIDPAVEQVPMTVNIVFEKVVTRNAESNFQTIRGFLDRMGVTVNCRFLCNTTYDSVRRFCSAQINLLAYRDYTGSILEDFFRKEYGCDFFDEQFPVGFLQTAEWLEDLGDIFGKDDVAQRIIDENRQFYRQGIEEVRPHLSGKRILVITYNHDVDWILSAAMDAGMTVCKLCILNFSQDEGFRSDLAEIADIPVEEDYDPARRAEDIENYRPDILLSNYETSVARGNCLTDTIPMCPDVGFFSGLNILRKWADMFGMRSVGGWENDQRLFTKYYSR